MNDERGSQPDPNPAENTGLPDKSGWDDAPRTKDVPWHDPMVGSPRKRMPARAKYLIVTAAFFALVVLVGAVVLPNWLLTDQSYYASLAIAAVQNLKSIATAQSQYIKKKDVYAASGWELNANGTLIAPDLSGAFELWQNNGDAKVPTRKAGYFFRMLQGDSASGSTGFYKTPGVPSAGMNTWGAITRAAEPDITGDNQFLITEAGTVYKHAEPKTGDPMYKKFLLDAVPYDCLSADYTTIDQKLAALDWTPAR